METMQYSTNPVLNRMLSYHWIPISGIGRNALPSAPCCCIFVTSLGSCSSIKKKDTTQRTVFWTPLLESNILASTLGPSGLPSFFREDMTSESPRIYGQHPTLPTVLGCMTSPTHLQRFPSPNQQKLQRCYLSWQKSTLPVWLKTLIWKEHPRLFGGGSV